MSAEPPKTGSGRGGTGRAHITLNPGEAFDARSEACEIVGSNDLGDHRGDSAASRSAEFVR